MFVELTLPPVAVDCDVSLFPVTRFPRLAYAPSLQRALFAEARVADLIHIHGLFLHPTYAAFRAASSTRTPYVVSPHGSLDPWIRRTGRVRKAIAHEVWQHDLFRGAACVVGTTDEEVRLWPDYARDRPTFVVPNGIDLDEFQDLPSGEAFRSELGVGPTEQLVVHVGRLAAKKGLDTLVRALGDLHRSDISVHLALVGPDDEGLAPRLTALARSEGIPDWVHLCGFRDGGRRLEAIAAADVFALPSHTENFGIAVLEALAAGCPVVVSTEVNLAAQIAAAGAGIITPPTVDATARAVRDVLANPELGRKLAANGRVFANHFGWDVVAGEMVGLYTSLI
jgi:glycosyltransferase involved in cell wall biosynthesis